MGTKRSIIEEALLSLPDDMQEIKDMQEKLREASTINQKKQVFKDFLIDNDDDFSIYRILEKAVISDLIKRYPNDRDVRILDGMRKLEDDDDIASS